MKPSNLKPHRFSKKESIVLTIIILAVVPIVGVMLHRTEPPKVVRTANHIDSDIEADEEAYAKAVAEDEAKNKRSISVTEPSAQPNAPSKSTKVQDTSSGFFYTPSTVRTFDTYQVPASKPSTPVQVKPGGYYTPPPTTTKPTSTSNCLPDGAGGWAC